MQRPSYQSQRPSVPGLPCAMPRYITRLATLQQLRQIVLSVRNLVASLYNAEA